MARVTVEDCLDHVDNRFQLVVAATKRARALAETGIEPEVPWDNDKVSVVALREIAEGKLDKTGEVKKPEPSEYFYDTDSIQDDADGAEAEQSE